MLLPNFSNNMYSYNPYVYIMSNAEIHLKPWPRGSQHAQGCLWVCKCSDHTQTHHFLHILACYIDTRSNSVCVVRRISGQYKYVSCHSGFWFDYRELIITMYWAIPIMIWGQIEMVYTCSRKWYGHGKV